VYPRVVPITAAARDRAPGAMRRLGAILLISCYELGHQPLGVASPLGFREGAGYAPEGLDISVEGLDAEKVARVHSPGEGCRPAGGAGQGRRARSRGAGANSAFKLPIRAICRRLASQLLIVWSGRKQKRGSRRPK